MALSEIIWYYLATAGTIWSITVFIANSGSAGNSIQQIVGAIISAFMWIGQAGVIAFGELIVKVALLGKRLIQVDAAIAA